jgi:hypothetical protein
MVTIPLLLRLPFPRRVIILKRDLPLCPTSLCKSLLGLRLRLLFLHRFFLLPFPRMISRLTIRWILL